MTSLRELTLRMVEVNSDDLAEGLAVRSLTSFSTDNGAQSVVRLGFFGVDIFGVRLTDEAFLHLGETSGTGLVRLSVVRCRAAC